MNKNEALMDKVADLYDWIDQEIRSHPDEAGECYACGACCDFERFGHRLFVTSVEMAYFAEKIGSTNLKPMTEGVCPYRVNHRCSVHSHRFAGCRIFCCRGDDSFQHRLSDEVHQKLKVVSQEMCVPYRYTDLGQALKDGIKTEGIK